MHWDPIDQVFGVAMESIYEALDFYVSLGCILVDSRFLWFLDGQEVRVAVLWKILNDSRLRIDASTIPCATCKIEKLLHLVVAYFHSYHLMLEE